MGSKKKKENRKKEKRRTQQMKVAFFRGKIGGAEDVF